MRSIVLIPSLRPKQKLIELVKQIQEVGLKDIVIVDDGSGKDYAHIFSELEKLGCLVYTHEINLGKGMALKNGMKFAMQNYEDVQGFVTADSDFQHLPKDILRVAKAMQENPNKIVLGERNFNLKHVPFKSRWGNRFSALYFKLSTGVKIEDTQTGLRGIPVKYYDMAINTEGERFEYEMNFLTKVAKEKIGFEKIYIETVYEENNSGSHFKALKDSMLIFQEFIKYASSSLLCAVIDVTVFTLIVNNLSLKEGLLVLSANILARIISGTFNFYFNRKIVFKATEKANKQAIKYICLFITQMIISSTLVAIASNLPINITLLKVIIDTIIFLINYIIQKRVIFK